MDPCDQRWNLYQRQPLAIRVGKGGAVREVIGPDRFQDFDGHVMQRLGGRRIDAAQVRRVTPEVWEKPALVADEMPGPVQLRAEKIRLHGGRIVCKHVGLLPGREHANAIQHHASEPVRLLYRHFQDDVRAGMAAIEIRLRYAHRVHDPQRRLGVPGDVRRRHRWRHGVPVT
jgi:hypothetical protein